MREQVVAIAVTYNDYAYLKKALDALRAQTFPVSKIVVVDNNSSDENKEKLKKEIDGLVDVVWLEENLGGAGGFERGMRYAHEKYDPSWYWLMDADAYPRYDCLEQLLHHQKESENLGILAPLIYGVDLQQYQLYHIKNVSKLLYRDLPLYSSEKEIPAGTSHVETDAFVGPLIARRAVEDLGYPDGELFIYGDDHEYTYRVTRKYDMLLVKEAVINHRDQPIKGVQKPENWWKEYYAFRNRILFIKKYRKNIIHELTGIALLYLRVLKQFFKNLVAPYNPKMKKYRYKLLSLAIADGLSGKMGKVLDPMAFRVKMAEINQGR